MAAALARTLASSESYELENAILRRLVTDMWTGMCNDNEPCESCRNLDDGVCSFERRMMTLGINVDDCETEY